jgi:O-antigen ligase/tetratricopeptide (TPR) repeat protein
MEGIVLVLVALLPWAFGGVDPRLELIQAVATALLLLGWAAVACLNGRLSFARCPVTLVLIALFLLGGWQLVPLPTSLLKVFSPSAASLNSELLPHAPEQLTESEPPIAANPMRPISVYPHATRADLFHWLEVLVLFAVVRHQLASMSSLRRIAMAAVATGIAIALFGLVQTLRSGTQKVFGFETGGIVFGPFINRNHAACFLNLCVGLTVGLLLYHGTDVTEYRRRAIQKPNAVQEQDEAALFSPLAVLHSPVQLWLLAALTILLAGVVCTLSRGGVACLAISFFAAFALRMTWPPRVGRLEYLILPAVLITGLLAWIGIRPLETRLATLLKGDVFADSRWQIWSNLITLAPSFPVFGSGYGTLQYVEPLARRQANLLELPGILIDHAHNDYLEALIEGGIVRLALTVALASLIAVYGVRAMRRYSGRKPAAWAFGCLIGALAVILHSAVDFSLQTPAVACLATVVCAQLVSLNRSDPNGPPSAAHPTVLTLRFSGLGVIAVAVASLAVGSVAVLHAWKADQTFRYRLAAFHSLQRVSPPDFDKAITYLESAASIDPADADMQLELGQVYLDRNVTTNRLTESVLPGLRHIIDARNDCPLLPRPQMRLAAFQKYLYRADPAEEYWQRAERLAPSDSDFWYLRGMYAFRNGRPGKAWEYWRRSLQLAGGHLKEIVTNAYPTLGVRGLLAEIMPDDAEQLVKAAELISDRHPADLNLLYAAADKLLESREEDLSAEEFFLKARCAEQLGAYDKAMRAYRMALDLDSSKTEWHWKFALLLYDAEKLPEALREIREVLKVWPPRPDIDEKLRATERLIQIR